MAHFGSLLRKSGRATGQAALPIPTPLTNTHLARAQSFQSKPSSRGEWNFYWDKKSEMKLFFLSEQNVTYSVEYTRIIYFIF